MAASKKPPEDETIRGLPPFAKGDSFVGDTSGARKATTGEVAPEVSQGPWRERAFKPRAVQPKEEIVRELEGGLRVALGSAKLPRLAAEAVRGSWSSPLRQALEQGGGDGLDVWLVTLLKQSTRRPMDPLFSELVAGQHRMRAAKDLAQFEEEALKVIELVRQTLAADQPRRLSFKQLERELEGKLEIDELLAVACAGTEELQHRVVEIGNTMGQLRDQIQKMPGRQPDGMYANFVRLKAELRVIDAELKARVSPTTGP